ncbi:MAG: D-TA family PLP-dependent enzyme [Candidatus Kapabacteria bacterium]|jgi:D-serine deaminase-like pyridoxal phosphate-dependent protein|nr:D-TA family PLP-dependent enzyme [Candidatus Kapabacteria bacterium]
MNTPACYTVQNAHNLDSPSLLIYKDRAERNIRRMIERTGGREQLIPHIKTNKMPAIVAMMLDAGIKRFKCATIAEAEMLAMTGATYVVIAHQLVPPKTARLLALKQKYPDVFFASLLDNLLTAQQHSEFFTANSAVSEVFLDINNGMNRSGAMLESSNIGEIFTLYRTIAEMPHIRLHGLHAYDGHIRHDQFVERQSVIESGFASVEALTYEIAAWNGTPPMVIAGGTPAFSTHSAHVERFCSPGTCVLWDWGYESILPEQEYEYAALVLTRIISKPHQGLISVDMGHKAVAAENPMHKRVRFLNLANYELLSQSEEHSVIRLADEAAWNQVCVGDVLYAVPYHVCPTVNLYDEAYWVENGVVTGVREVLARKRRITV